MRTPRGRWPHGEWQPGPPEKQQVSVEQFYSDVGVTIRCWC